MFRWKSTTLGLGTSLNTTHTSGQDHVEVFDLTVSRGECCVQAQELHPVGTVIGHELSEDNCTEVTTRP